jgi:hypothetical protein
MNRAALLLADPSPSLRLLVLRELLGRPAEDGEVRELASLQAGEPALQDLLARQGDDGAWSSPDGVADSWHGIHSTAQALLHLAYLSLSPGHPASRRAASYLFALQNDDGSWPLPKTKAERELREPYTMIPLQTALPLRALTAAGFGTDPRAERAFDWLLGQQLPDGSWPSGIKSGQTVFPAGYRRLANSRFGCRTNTTFAVSALAHHPTRRTGPAAQRGLDHLLAQGSQHAHSLGHEVARTVGLERASGFFTYFARHDTALLLDLCWRAGASREDARVAQLVSFVEELKGPFGLWEYPARPEAARWVSFDLLRSLSRVAHETDWLGREPPLPFQPYPKRERRY